MCLFVVSIIHISNIFMTQIATWFLTHSCVFHFQLNPLCCRMNFCLVQSRQLLISQESESTRKQPSTNKGAFNTGVSFLRLGECGMQPRNVSIFRTKIHERGNLLLPLDLFNPTSSRCPPSLILFPLAWAGLNHKYPPHRHTYKYFKSFHFYQQPCIFHLGRKQSPLNNDTINPCYYIRTLCSPSSVQSFL